jgi:hypothetical protein
MQQVFREHSLPVDETTGAAAAAHAVEAHAEEQAKDPNHHTYSSANDGSEGQKISSGPPDSQQQATEMACLQLCWLCRQMKPVCTAGMYKARTSPG